jgi:hypothetical protein
VKALVTLARQTRARAPTASHLGKGEQEAVRADDAPQLLALDLRLVPAVMLDAEVHAAVEPLRSDLVRPLVALSAVICLLDGRYRCSFGNHCSAGAVVRRCS